MRIRGVRLLLLSALVAACHEAPFQARFAVRGRWPGERALAYRVEAEHGALAPATFVRSIRSALDEWAATGCATFHEARPEETPALTFAWALDEHGDCVPFGSDPSVAHAGPIGPGTFVHFDAGRAWDGPALRQAALHEIGHVLGLDHSPDETSVMYPEPSPARDRLAPCDLAGIHSLYGGGEPAPGDVVVASGGAELVLHSIAPPALTDWQLFDTDGDGDEELVVWRTDADGHGALWCYHFASGPVLERALGPLYGVVAPGLEPSLETTASGQRLLVLQDARGAVQARAFDSRGALGSYAGEVPPGPRANPSAATSREGDLDGDGRMESVMRLP